MGPGERRFAVLVGVLATAAVLVPGVRLLADEGAPDGFPLSTYPMFARDRGRVVEVATVVVARDGGEVERLSPSTIAGTDQVVEASVVVATAVRRGPTAAAALCEEVLGRARGLGPDAELQVVVERYDTVRWAAGDDDPDERRVVAACR